MGVSLAGFYDQLDDDDDGLNNNSSGSGSGRPLEGLKVVIIHVKDNLKDGPTVGEVVLEQLREMEQGEGLGCEFSVARAGEGVCGCDSGGGKGREGGMVGEKLCSLVLGEWEGGFHLYLCLCVWLDQESWREGAMGVGEDIWVLF